MVAFAVAVGAVALVAGASAQSNEHVWSSVAFMFYGERTPLRGSVDPTLTPYGAQQMYAQGNMFRARYLDNTTVALNSNYVPIKGIERNAIDNTQLNVMANTDSYVTASALAFLQGLYPPLTQAIASDAGGMPTAMLANGTLINYPLNGYQYPNVQSLSVLDLNSIW
jgi:hypothetical protein